MTKEPIGQGQGSEDAEEVERIPCNGYERAGIAAVCRLKTATADVNTGTHRRQSSFDCDGDGGVAKS